MAENYVLITDSACDILPETLAEWKVQMIPLAFLFTDTGKEQKITIQSSSGLSEEEIQKMVREAEQHSAEDKKFADLANARNRADAVIHSYKKQMSENGDKLPENIKTELNQAINNLENACRGDDLAAIEAAEKKLQDVAGSLSQYAQQAGAGANPGANAGANANAGNNANGGARDADFEEV